MPHPYWPFFDLRVRTGRLELRMPTDEVLVQLAHLAVRGIHDPAVMPFAIPWTDKPPGELERSFLQYHWSTRAGLCPEHWDLQLAVWAEGELVGVQGVRAVTYPAQRTVETGSWLGRAFQRRGIGREMRIAILHLAFAGLGAETALSSAFADNTASQRISLGLGYRLESTDIKAPRGIPMDHYHFRLNRAEWQAQDHPPVVIEGLEPCLPLLGATPR